MDVEIALLIVKRILLLKGEKKLNDKLPKILVSVLAKITRGSNELKRMNRKLLMYLKERMLE